MQSIRTCSENTNGAQSESSIDNVNKLNCFECEYKKYHQNELTSNEMKKKHKQTSAEVDSLSLIHSLISPAAYFQKQRDDKNRTETVNKFFELNPMWIFSVSFGSANQMEWKERGIWKIYRMKNPVQ